MAGSSMLTFWVLPYWNITPQALEMISHPVTLYWHWSDQFWFLALLKAECQAKEQLVLFLKSLVGLKEEIINLGENKKKKKKNQELQIHLYLVLWSTSVELLQPRLLLGVPCQYISRFLYILELERDLLLVWTLTRWSTATPSKPVKCTMHEN